MTFSFYSFYQCCYPLIIACWRPSFTAESLRGQGFVYFQISIQAKMVMKWASGDLTPMTFPELLRNLDCGHPLGNAGGAQSAFC